MTLDYGQFGLSGNPSRDADNMQLIERAIAGPGIASDEYGIIVLSPHQNNFEMSLRIEEWDRRPPDDDTEWEEIFESRLVVTGGVLYYHTPTLEGASCDVPNRRYAVRICGRGFVNRGWPGSTTPGDRWRVQLWPFNGDLPDRRVKEWQQPGDDSRH